LPQHLPLHLVHHLVVVVNHLVAVVGQLVAVGQKVVIQEKVEKKKMSETQKWVQQNQTI
jgi:hypothetical protein